LQVFIIFDILNLQALVNCTRVDDYTISSCVGDISWVPKTYDLNHMLASFSPLGH